MEITPSKILLIFIVSYVWSSSCIANSKIDSLLQVSQSSDFDESYSAIREIATIYRNSFDLKNERIYLNKALDLAEGKLTYKAKAGTQYAIATNLINQSSYDSAHYFLNQAQLNYFENGDTTLAYKMDEFRANTYQQENKLPEALEIYQNLITIYEKDGSSEGYFDGAILRCNAAYVQILQKNYDLAIEYLRPCYAHAALFDDEEDKKKFYEISVNFDLFMARAFEEKMQLDSAVIYYQRTLETSRDIQYPYTEAYALAGLGKYESNVTGNHSKANGLFDEAIKIFRSVKDIQGLIPTLAAAANSKMIDNQISQSKKLADEAIQLSIETNHIEGLKDGYKVRSDWYRNQGQLDLAISDLENYMASKDSIVSIERDKVLKELDAKYKKAEQDREIEYLQTTSNLQRILFVLAMIALGAIAYFLLTRQKLLQLRKSSAYEKKISLALNKFVPQSFLKTLGREHILDVSLGDQIEQEVTVLFTDIRSYTSISENMTPSENFRFVKNYAERMGPIIVKHGGFINQFLGDGIMAIFQTEPEDALKACIDMQKELVIYNNENEDVDINVGMGMHTGPLVMGIIGDEVRRDAAVISDTVNTAARLESLTKDFKAKIIISEASFKRIESKELYRIRYLGQSTVKGKSKKIMIYECYSGDHPDMIKLKSETEVLFNQAVTAFEQAQFSLAEEYISKLENSNDLTIQYYIDKMN